MAVEEGKQRCRLRFMSCCRKYVSIAYWCSEQVFRAMFDHDSMSRLNPIFNVCNWSRIKCYVIKDRNFKWRVMPRNSQRCINLSFPIESQLLALCGNPWKLTVTLTCRTAITQQQSTLCFRSRISILGAAGELFVPNKGFASFRLKIDIADGIKE